MMSFKKFLKEKAIEKGEKDLGKDVLVYENLKGTIVGIQGSKRWIKVRGMQRQLVEAKDYRIIEKVAEK